MNDDRLPNVTSERKRTYHPPAFASEGVDQTFLAHRPRPRLPQPPEVRAKFDAAIRRLDEIGQSCTKLDKMGEGEEP